MNGRGAGALLEAPGPTGVVAGATVEVRCAALALQIGAR